MSDAIYLSGVRLSFPKLIEAVAPPTPPGAEKKFGSDFILPANHPDYARFMEEIGRVAVAKWKDQAGPILQFIQTDRRLRCWGGGNEKLKKETMKPYEGYDGMVYITGTSGEDRPPAMIDGNGDTCDPSNTMLRKELARKLYGGCYVNAALSLWAQDNQFGRAIRCNLLGIQFAKDGEPFGDAVPDMSGLFKPTQAAAPSVPGFGAPPMPWMK